MSKKSVYIANKSKVLFDMYAELDVLKGSKKSDANDAMIVSAQKSIDAFILRHNISKKSPLTGIRTGALA